jgi:ribosomal protein S18 acetylase RimI-like enzyme
VPEAINLSIATESTPELLEAVNRLLPQLSKSAKPMTASELDDLVSSPATELLVATADDAVVGLLTLVVFRIPTGVRGWIEDVVVDDSVRGRGVGKKLNEFALEVARRRGVRTVDLTSRPAREAANRLYQRLGFIQRDTNVYRFDVEGRPDSL